MFPFRVNQYLLAANELERNSLYCLYYLYGINYFLGKDSDERCGWSTSLPLAETVYTVCIVYTL